MRAILIYKLKLRFGRRAGGDPARPGKSAGLLGTDASLGAERRWL